jgi:L-seryl-tRNA(Ser) seleniumtransferase
MILPIYKYGRGGEPTATTAVASGATLVLMSGDKLLGGPQAGIILGKASFVAKLRKNPFARAMRVDKLTLSALEATLRIYLEPERALRQVPVLAMLTEDVERIASRARAIVSSLAGTGVDAEVVSTSASVGGGAFPTAKIPSFAVAVSKDANRFEERLRRGDPPVIGRISNDRLLLDLRCVFPREDAALAHAIVRARA